MNRERSNIILDLKHTLNGNAEDFLIELLNDLIEENRIILEQEDNSLARGKIQGFRYLKEIFNV